MNEMPPLPDQGNEQAKAIEELNRKIIALAEEIDALALRLGEESGGEKRLSRGDALPDQESALTSGEETLAGQRRRRSSGGAVAGKTLELELSRKMQERAGYILERDGLITGKTGGA